MFDCSLLDQSLFIAAAVPTRQNGRCQCQPNSGFRLDYVYRVAHLPRERNMLTSNSKFRRWPESEDQLVNATFNLVSTYFFPKADGPPCRFHLKWSLHLRDGKMQKCNPYIKRICSSPLLPKIICISYFQESLGDVVYAQLPEPDDAVAAGEDCGALESVKGSDAVLPDFRCTNSILCYSSACGRWFVCFVMVKNITHKTSATSG